METLTLSNIHLILTIIKGLVLFTSLCATGILIHSFIVFNQSLRNMTQKYPVNSEQSLIRKMLVTSSLWALLYLLFTIT